MTKIEIKYTPTFFTGPVHRTHNFETKEEADQFLNRMKRLYPDTVEI